MGASFCERTALIEFSGIEFSGLEERDFASLAPL